MFLHSVQVFYLGRREGQSFLLVISLEVFYVEDGGRLDVDGEDALVQSVIHALEHRVMFRVGRSYGKILLYTRNAVEIHVLRNLYGIGAPGSYHFAARTYEPAFQRFTFFKNGVAIEPAEFLHFIGRELTVHFRGYDALLRSSKKQYHIFAEF